MMTEPTSTAATLPRIFVQIASYRDPECQWTVNDLFAKAKHPERITIGICWQYDVQGGSDAPCFVEPYTYPDQVRVVGFDYRDAKGANWGRVQAASLLRDEDYVYFSEPHMRHVDHWDEKLLTMYAQCPPNAVLSTAVGSGYTPPNNLERPMVTSMSPREFHPKSGALLTNVHHVPDTAIPEKPFPSAVLVVSCLFAPARLVHEVPQDPYIYYEGDESSYSARVYTHGWDIYNINEPICYHLHDRTFRPSHWDDVPKPSGELSELSGARYRYLFGMQDTAPAAALTDIARYGFGTARSLAEYEKFAGVDFKKRSIAPPDRWIITADEQNVRPAPPIIQYWVAQHSATWVLECIDKLISEEQIVAQCVKQGLSPDYAKSLYQEACKAYLAGAPLPTTAPLQEKTMTATTTTGSALEQLEPQWQRWLLRCLARFYEPNALIQAMVQNHMPAELAQQAMNEALRSPFMQELKDAVNETKTREWLLLMLDAQYREGGKYGPAIKRIKAPKAKTFFKDYYYENVPVVLKDAVSHWGVMQWTPESLKAAVGNATVQVQFGRDKDSSYEQNAASFRTDIGFDEYVDLILKTKKSNDFYMTAGNWEKSKHAFKELYNDIGNIADGYLEEAKTRDHGFLWVGPAGTITPLHHDLTNNLFVQVYGRKRFILIPSCQVPYTYNNQFVFSEVDIFNPDYERFPDLKKAMVMDFVLNPGDVLFIPNCWLHAVEALDTSISLTFNNFNASNYYPDYPGQKRYS